MVKPYVLIKIELEISQKEIYTITFTATFHVRNPFQINIMCPDCFTPKNKNDLNNKTIGIRSKE